MTEAIRNIPYPMFNDFNMDGQITIEYKYANDCSDEIQSQINANFTQEVFSQYLEKAGKKEQHYYGPTDTWLYDALGKYPIRDKNVCIMGSANPWYEAIAIANGAKRCTVIEYSKREAFHEKIEYIQPHEVGEEKFDACLSISSYEHDGLGRYGDPLNPSGDIEAMKKTKELLNKDALLYLAVPVGVDKLIFNAHRIYGKKRIPKLLSDWEIIENFGIFDDSFNNNINGTNGTPYQPLFVLKNT